ncbi:diguanylate cyclase domain-containing protein [Geopsychrobacter electrodiphilus]|uniref:diguanylate cyclase domain-containing protein n=1 Tax=Geopsychrobacter electrodiphilus TaxID=225196 RepID=UPI0003622AAD|nr:diguanylate cyclase [Geopsychrobacter electrodiphilus]
MIPKRPLSLKARMSFSVMALVLVIMAGVGGLSLHYFKRSFQKLIADQQSTLIEQIAKQIDRQLQDASSLITATAGSFPLDRLKNAELAQSYLDTQLGLGTTSMFDNGIFLFTADGRLLAEYPFKPDRRGRDYSFRKYFQDTLRSGQPQISDPYVSSQKQKHPAVNFTAPIRNDKGQILAVIAGSVDLTRKNFLGGLSAVRIGRTGYLYLFNTDRLMIMHPDPRRIMKKDVPLGANLWFDRAIEGFEGTEETVNSRGLHTLVSFKRLNSNRWILAANYPTHEAFQPIAQVQRFFIVGLGIILIFCIVVTWVVTRTLLAPLARLTAHVAGFSPPDADKSHPVRGQGDEITTLAATFDGLMTEVAREREFTLNLLQNSATPCFVLDVNHRVLIWTQAVEKLTGLKANDILGTNLHWQAFYPSERPCLADIVLDKDYSAAFDLYPLLADSPLVENSIQAEGWLKLYNGRSKYLTFDAAPIHDQNGTLVAVIQTLHDLTNLKHTEKTLRETQESYHALIDSSPDAIIVHRHANVLYANRAANILFCAKSKEDLVGRSLNELIHPHYHKTAFRQISEVETKKNTHLHVEEQIIRLDGKSLDVEIGRSVTFYAGEAAVQSVLRDITLRKAAQDLVWQQANFDALTGLPNRSLFMDRLKQALGNCDRDKHLACLMFIDLDQFKAVNDTLGHDNGDELLRQVAKRMSTCLRETDTVARLGGDEFTIILPVLKDVNEVLLPAERLLKTLAEPFVLPGGIRQISASIGGAIYPHDSKSIADLMCVADTAMYQVKQTGRNSYYFPHLEKSAGPTPATEGLHN